MEGIFVKMYKREIWEIFGVGSATAWKAVSLSTVSAESGSAAENHYSALIQGVTFTGFTGRSYGGLASINNGLNMAHLRMKAREIFGIFAGIGCQK